MRFVHSDGADSTRRKLDLMPLLRVAVALYWLGSFGLGYLRLRVESFSRHALGEVMTTWYAEALVFLAVFGGGALLAGLLSRQTRQERVSKVTDPLDNTTLAAIERHRAH